MAKSNSMNSYAAKRRKEMATSKTVAVGERKSIDIKRAENGFVVSQWIPGTDTKPGRDRLIICKTLEEAQAAAAGLLKM
jgi:hypothetical protein